jgi:hypothetical protein
MTNVTIKPYASPTCVLLAFDWPDGERYPDFLGFGVLQRHKERRGRRCRKAA